MRQFTTPEQTAKRGVIIGNGDNSTYELALEDALKYALEHLI